MQLTATQRARRQLVFSTYRHQRLKYTRTIKLRWYAVIIKTKPTKP